MLGTHAGRSIVPLVLGLAAILAVAYAAASRGPGGGAVRNIEVLPAFDTGDPRKLVGFATDVFVGRVVGPRGGGGEQDAPHTTFAVEVRESIKGRASGVVPLRQMGGRDADGALVLFEGQPLLRPGDTYLLVARRHPRSGEYHLVAPGDDAIRVTDGAERGELVRKYRRAHLDEVPVGPAAP